MRCKYRPHHILEVVLLFIALSGFSASNSKANEDSKYLDAVREFADNVLKYGRDIYGPKHTPLFVDGLNIHTHEPVKWIAPNGDRWILSNLASQQTLFRTLDGLTRITGDPKYKQAAMDAIKYAFENLRSPNGLLYWGVLAAYDAQADKVYSSKWHHVLKINYPYYELMWQVDAKATRDVIEAFWSAHILDWSNLDMNRYGYFNDSLETPWNHEYKGGPVPFKSKRGIGMFTTGTSLAYAAALLSQLSGEEQPLVWSKRLIQRYVDTRDPKIGISAHTFNDSTLVFRMFPMYPFEWRYLDFPEERHVHPWLSVLLIGKMFGEEGSKFTQWALEELTAWGKASYRRDDNSFVPVRIDGTNMEGYVQENRPIGMNIAKPCPVEPQYFWAYCAAYHATSDEFMWQMARDIAIGNSLGDIGESLTDTPKLPTGTQCSDVYGLLGFLELYAKTNKPEFLQIAQQIGDNIVDKQFYKGFFVPSKRHVYARFDCYEPLALLRLFAVVKPVSKSIPAVWPSLPLFRPPYRYKNEGNDRLIIYTLTDSAEPPLSLQEAASIGNFDLVKSLIEKGTYVDSIDDAYFKTALHRAAISGHKEIAELLINAGARIDAKAGSDTPLHYAVEYGHKDIAELLIANCADLNAARDYPAGDTPLHTAVRVGNKDIIELLVAKGADLNVKNNDGLTPLGLAVNKGYVDTAEILINKGADINSVDNRGNTLLHRVAQNGQQDIAELLIEKGADINIKNKSGETPLYIAIMQGRMPIVRTLMAKGAEVSSIFVAAAIGDLAKVKAFLEEGTDVNAKGTRGQTALHIAACEGHKQIVELLLENGADVNAGASLNRTAAEMAMDNNHSDIVELLISKGADVSPLHLAISMKDETKALSLIENGADVNKKTRYGTTPLHTAVQAGMKNIVELLIKKGADINAKNNWGWTPLNFSIYSGKEDIFELIVAAGADVNTKSGADKSPLSYAKQRGLTEIVEILRKHGAKEDGEEDKKQESVPAPKEDKETDPNAVSQN